jgi:hypothetical protein
VKGTLLLHTLEAAGLGCCTIFADRRESPHEGHVLDIARSSSRQAK